jgi:hypothetical protein
MDDKRGLRMRCFRPCAITSAKRVLRRAWTVNRLMGSLLRPLEVKPSWARSYWQGVARAASTKLDRSRADFLCFLAVVRDIDEREAKHGMQTKDFPPQAAT